MTTRKKPPAPRRKPTPVAAAARRRPSKPIAPARPERREAAPERRETAAERPRAAAPVRPREAVPEPAIAAIAIPEAGVAEPAIRFPEPVFAARVPSPAPPRPQPPTRRAIFFDVENTSRAEHIARVIEHLAVDRLSSATDVVAVGNWKVIGQDTARLLARHGAHLVHSAPSTGVRDWSDLRIAVGAGVWVAGARPGDVLEIISDDRAFDAVGDVAASLGIAYRRLSYRGLAGLTATETVERPMTAAPLNAPGQRRGRRRGGWRGRPDSGPARPPVSLPVRPPADVVLNGAEAPSIDVEEPSAAPALHAEPHTAPHDEIVAVVRRLLRGSSAGAVSIDAVANALREEGFRRPPGSPRLITRLRRIKELSFGRSGMITLIDGGRVPETVPSAPPVEEPAASPEVTPVRQVVARPSGAAAREPEEPMPGDVDGNRLDAQGRLAEGAEPAASRFRGARRGGRRGRGRGRGPSRAAAPASPEA